MSGARLIVLAGFAVSLYGQATPKDIHGWDKVNWGMTMAQVRAVYEVEAQPESKEGWTLLQLPSAKLGDIPMGVQVGAREGTTKVATVRLWWTFGLPGSAPTASAQDFEKIRAALIQKYGDPASEDEAHGENFRLLKSVRWTFPSTSILMSLEQSSSLPNLGTIYVDYTAREVKR